MNWWLRERWATDGLGKMIPFFMTKTPMENRHDDNEYFKKGRLISELKQHNANCWKAQRLRSKIQDR